MYVHGDRDMLAMLEGDFAVKCGSTEGSMTNLTLLPFSPALGPSFAEAGWLFLAPCSRGAKLRTSRALNT